MTIKDLRNINHSDAPIELTIDQLMEYIHCPNYFYLKYMSRIPLKNIPTYKDLLHQIINMYIGRLLNGKIMPMSEAKKHWDKLVDEYPSSLSSKNIIEGLGILNQIDHYCRNNKVVIADLNSPFQNVFSNNIIIKGLLGPIRYYDNKTLELFIIETSQKIPDQTLVDMSLKYTMQLFAVNSISSNFKINGIRILHVKSGNEITTYRTQKDFDRLKKTISNVGKSIRNEIFYPREDYTCPRCLYKNYCGYI